MKQFSDNVLLEHSFVQISNNLRKNPVFNTNTGFCILAEMEGFEPPHVLRRLADFESAPFSHLGTSPYS